MIDYIDTKRIQELSDKDTTVPIYQKVIKLGEESGELAQAFLKMDKAKNVSATAGDSTEGVLEEACDILNVTIDIINALTKDNPDLEIYTRETFQRKLDKWESKQKAFELPKIPVAPEPRIISEDDGRIKRFFNSLSLWK